MRIAIRTLLTIGIVAVILGGAVFIMRSNDTLYAVYKRLKADSVYTFDEVNPALLETDPEDLLSIRSQADVDSTRHRVTNWVYGGVDGERRGARLYDPGIKWSHASELSGWRGLGTVTQFYINVRPDVLSFAYHLTPRDASNGKAMIYHHGMASDFQAARGWLEPFLQAGWNILVFEQLGYGENSVYAVCDIPTVDPTCRANLHSQLDRISRPVAPHVEPVLAGVDYLQSKGFSTVDAMGFSAGATVVTFAAALDTRIRRTAAVAGILPMYLREGQDEAFGVARQWAQAGLGSFLDLFVMAASGENRRYLQLFNRYDRCCFRNLKGRVYEPAVRRAVAATGSGRFDVHIDETHARHKVSAAGVEVIMAFLRDADHAQ